MYIVTCFFFPSLVSVWWLDMDYAQCMRHVLTAVDSSDLVALLEQTRLSSKELAESADKEAAGLAVHHTYMYNIM